jgi:SAM-dependent methyltransferase
MSGTYDCIARFYDVDMARNMPFDDVGFYAGICLRQGGRTLELGCGNGRILLDLISRGVDAIGVDSSAAMLTLLARKAEARGLPAPVCRMDIRALALAPGFATILCPYSLITYVTEDDDVDRLFAACRGLLAPGGVFVVDAFVPGPATSGDGFVQDYRRPFESGVLERAKRIVPLSPQRNRIERRYRVLGADGALREEIEIAEEIRPFAPEALRARLEAAGFAIDDPAWDYGHGAAAAGARFVTLTARPVRGAGAAANAVA